MEPNRPHTNVLSPDQQLVKYGEILSVLINAYGEYVHSQPVFKEAYLGNYERHPSLTLAEHKLKRYDKQNPPPPIVDIIGRAHTILRAGVTRLPQLDTHALHKDTQCAMQAFDDVLREYQALVKATEEKDTPADYERIKPEYFNAITKKAIRIINALNASELVTSLTIPVIVTSADGKLEHMRAYNQDDLGSFLFTLPYISQNQVSKNRVPGAFIDFLTETAGISIETVKKEVNVVYSSPSLKAQATAVFESMNQQLHDVFLRGEHVLQIAALTSPSDAETYQDVLKDLGLCAKPEQLDNALEATVVLESLASNHESKQLDESVRQFSNHIKDNAPPADVLNKTQAALTQITEDDDATKEKLVLLQEYITQQIKAATAAYVPGKIRQNTMAVG